MYGFQTEVGKFCFRVKSVIQILVDMSTVSLKEICDQLATPVCVRELPRWRWPSGLFTSLSFNSFHPFSTRQSSSISPFYLLRRPGSSRRCGSIPMGTGGDWSAALPRLSEEQTSLYACSPPLSLSIHPRLPPQGQEIIRPTVLLHSVIAGLCFFKEGGRAKREFFLLFFFLCCELKSHSGHLRSVTH